ncbi:dTDP-4-dehydrorhamnose 3,5-epimerase [Moraxella caviae]|uniref:dTDP-4-dehydrorhamnose 3,5-epimerase n=1 Tax=Moraxella caviae TaxID=34060 RepID=A0A1T0A3Q0_9GAMM|nr:dTDP-4-dehydrorhamnose 3,5-epimerase [Moraxella caviae]OOR90189.1 dTDP-4-dehydrorhamnose 3,5-epimerase [Moraxella caviae]STZ14593.1 dTDP-4-dehydrorhamnose 3,5-epimerase [Moraxella caviae]VEW11362.1 dTDP-4-dehydrorhamnose 3,5-epimerase [Moraxella caviae]
MNVIETKIPELLIFEPRVFGDERGWFMESFNEKTFAAALSERGFDVPHFVQDNHSFSAKGVLRGLHYQLNPHAQGKLVRVVSGRAWDVAVDIRKDSPTFGQWVGVELSADNHRQFWIPAGFAHGFIALEDGTQFLYKTTNFYHKDSERSIAWNDADLAIDWQFAGEPLLTDKDKLAPTLHEAKALGDVF